MFKAIIPKRGSTSDFEILTNQATLGQSSKENVPSSHRPKSKSMAFPGGTFSFSKDGKTCDQRDQPNEEVVMEQAFERLLDDLQVPSTVRVKLATMESTVKAAMLKGSQNMSVQSPVSPPMTPKSLRRTRSSIDSPNAEALWAGTPSRPSMSREKSMEALPRSSMSGESGGKRSKSKDGKGSMRNFSPAAWVSILADSSSMSLEIETVKKLRLLLRNETASWTQAFLTNGGYSALLTRLNEILEVEWREEQHDDQILHEFLRCFKALTTSSIGCFALRSSSPTPFVQLMSLLYSDKKPGDVATRQVMVELIMSLFELYPPSSLPSTSSNRRREIWEDDAAHSSLITLPAPHRNVFSFIRALLLTPAPAPSESPSNPVSPHAFIEELHKPRIYKTYLQELSDICRDYFWVFCHPNNTIWNLVDTDEAKVEKPRAPGGMTGGVEFEAMTYLTTHLRLINACARAAEDLQLSKDDESSAHQFHADLFLSGFERILLIARKASATYYPTLHLEIARYVASAGRVRFELPWNVQRLIGPPPPSVCKPRTPRVSEAPAASPTKKQFLAATAASALRREPLPKFD